MPCTECRIGKAGWVGAGRKQPVCSTVNTNSGMEGLGLDAALREKSRRKGGHEGKDHEVDGQAGAGRGG